MRNEMAHFAQLDSNNIVTQVIVVNNAVINNLPFPESEPIGIDFCKSLYGPETIWKQTSYNGNFRKHFASIGCFYLPSHDVFLSQKPEKYPSFVLSEDLEWVPPIPRPTDGVYKWNEKLVSWVPIPKPPYPSWTAQGSPLKWTPPIPMPNVDARLMWDESSQNWVQIQDPSTSDDDEP